MFLDQPIQLDIIDSGAFIMQAKLPSFCQFTQQIGNFSYTNQQVEVGTVFMASLPIEL